MGIEDQAPGRPTVTMVTAPWCRVCTAIRPIVSEVVESHPGVDLRIVDATVDPAGVAARGVRGTPTLIGERDGEERFRVVGARSRADLDRLVTGLIEGAGPAATGPTSTDTVVRLLAGAGVVAVGAAASAWPLLVAGAGLILWAAVGWMRTR